MGYSEFQLTALATSNPKELVRIITSPNSDVHALTFGAEILGGEVKDESLVLPALRQLLKHVNAVVREGAMLGVSAFYMEARPLKTSWIACKKWEPMILHQLAKCWPFPY